MPLDYKIAKQVFHTIQNSQLADLRKMLYKAAIRYATIRAEWQFLSTEEKLDRDSERTTAHNRFIDSCNIFSRQQAKVEEQNNWRNEISMDRKMIGDFACYLNCFIGIKNR